jgi:hypothetical protein
MAGFSSLHLLKREGRAEMLTGRKNISGCVMGQAGRDEKSEACACGGVIAG